MNKFPKCASCKLTGRSGATQLEDIMSAFYDKQFDVLLSTTIVEFGLDIPNANTLIVHRADMFGLAQLYQLRGRVGCSKTRAYAMFTIPPNGKITAQAEKRLKVLHSLDSLGAGFTLASHDLDLRGAGNLLGEEQSGHIKEVGYELYQSMLEEAVHALKEQGTAAEQEEQWSPTNLRRVAGADNPTATCRTCRCGSASTGACPACMRVLISKTFQLSWPIVLGPCRTR